MGKWIYRSVLSVSLLAVFLVGIYWYVSKFAENEVFDDVALIPRTEVALVLGTSSTVDDGRPNLFFLRRIDAAYELYENGVVNKLLLSGDNSTEDYNEPESMMLALIDKGVPEEDLFLDYAGFRTLDSVVRANEIFGQDSLVIVSQRFHNERAIFIAKNIGIESYAYNADSPGFKMAPRVFLREILARVNMVWDLFIFDTEPKYLGEEIEI